MKANRETLTLDQAARHLLEECRMVLPGIQALFGFQLVAVFNTRFPEALSPSGQRLHLCAIILTVIAIALIMAPAAYHRQTTPREVSEDFLRLATRLMLWSMTPLSLSICIDVYLLAQVILRHQRVALALSALTLIMFVSLWVGLPARRRATRR